MPFSRQRYQFSVRGTKVFKILQAYILAFSTFRNQTAQFYVFRMLFNVMVMSFTISIFLKILYIMQLVY